ncbi:hypothetical protein OPKNFCMD_1299 [Methylobacterium crusticola]|uniref:Uncharacterized protein n=1 Tax=Methylobacterium crusticola TaxID=1697972 RepID=A0ABQ4QVH1_9HYPH|nr:hypothetical protein [Methylobacterium crusticola]GJD48577.1 hypothetical protein OPKNFCMD_1299 [Methylobacterium crusticola]
MRVALVAASGLLALATAAPAFATPCAEQIATIERRLESPGAASVTGSTPTQTGSPRALPAPPAGPPSDPASKPTAAGIEQARTLIAAAKDQDRAGNAAACEDTMTRAKEMIGALP